MQFFHTLWCIHSSLSIDGVMVLIVRLTKSRFTWAGSLNEGLISLFWPMGILWEIILINGHTHLLCMTPFSGQEILNFVELEWAN